MNHPSSRLVLHGYPVSNYFNIAHAALLEKGLPFEVVLERAAQSDEFLARSPMGKIPYLESPQGFIAETVAILEYLEDLGGGTPLLPVDAGERARVRQVINIVQVYVEVPMRSLFPGVFFGGTNTQVAIGAAAVTIDRAMGALGRLVQLQPFLVGQTLSSADLFAFYCFDIAERVMRFVYGQSLLDRIEGLAAWKQRMAMRASSQQVLAAFAPTFAQYLVAKNAAYRE